MQGARPCECTLEGISCAMTTLTLELPEALSAELELLEKQQLNDIDWALNAAKS